ncbi:unnamed protein product [Closterium sp. Yama58-4]|nr:unnamed protein product [Closterium sp. Yama58-4]
MIRELGRPTAPVVPTVDQLPPPLDLHPHPPPPAGPPANVLPASSREPAVFPRSLPHPHEFLPQPLPLAPPEPPMVVRLPPHAVPGVWRVPPTGGATVFQPLVEPGIGARGEPPAVGPPQGVAPPPQVPPANPHDHPARGEAAAVATAAGEGVSTEPRSRCSPARRRPGGLRVGGRIVLDRLSRRGAGAPRALEVETQLLVRLWHMRTYYAVVGALLENAAVSLSRVPLAACTMGHAQLMASRDGAWLLRHEMEIAEEEPVGEPLSAAEADAEMEASSAAAVSDALIVVPHLRALLRHASEQQEVLFTLIKELSDAHPEIKNPEQSAALLGGIQVELPSERECELMQKIAEMRCKVATLVDNVITYRKRNAQLEKQVAAFQQRKEERERQGVVLRRGR